MNAPTYCKQYDYKKPYGLLFSCNALHGPMFIHRRSRPEEDFVVPWIMADDPKCLSVTTRNVKLMTCSGTKTEMGIPVCKPQRWTSSLRQHISACRNKLPTCNGYCHQLFSIYSIPDPSDRRCTTLRSTCRKSSVVTQLQCDRSIT